MKLIKLLSESMINDNSIRKVYIMALKKYGEDMTFNQMIDMMKRIFGTFDESRSSSKFNQIIKVINEMRDVSRDNIINYFLDSHTVNSKSDFGDITCEIPSQDVEDKLYVDRTTNSFYLESIDIILEPVGYIMYDGTKIEIKDTIYYDDDKLIEKYPIINNYESFTDDAVEYITRAIEEHLIMKIGSRLDDVNVNI
jgi:hypothetical protein